MAHYRIRCVYSPVQFCPEPVNNYRENEPLIETDWLSLHLNDRDIRIVDMRSREEYDKEHVKNAVHLNIKEITGDEVIIKTNFRS